MAPFKTVSFEYKINIEVHYQTKYFFGNSEYDYDYDSHVANFCINNSATFVDEKMAYIWLINEILIITNNKINVNGNHCHYNSNHTERPELFYKYFKYKPYSFNIVMNNTAKTIYEGIHNNMSFEDFIYEFCSNYFTSYNWNIRETNMIPSYCIVEYDGIKFKNNNGKVIDKFTCIDDNENNDIEFFRYDGFKYSDGDDNNDSDYDSDEDC